MTKKSDEKLLETARKRFTKAQDHWNNIFAEYEKCIRFKHGEQWEEEEKKGRDEDQRPSLVFNRIAGHVNHIVGEQRQNRPAIKVLPVENADDEAADIRSGIIRMIEAASDAEEAYDTAFEASLSGGIGAFRINIDYSDDDTFTQDLRIDTIPNPLTVAIDPASKKAAGSDKMWAFVSEKMSRETFKERWPGKPVPSAGLGNDWKDWIEKDEVRVAEYWYKEPAKKTLLLMSDGSTLDADEMVKDQELAAQVQAQGLTIHHERVVKTHTVKKALIAGNIILEQHDWPGKDIPIVMVYGRMEWVDGKRTVDSIIKNAMDPQRLLNYLRSQEAESLALAPKSPWLVTAEMVDGFEDEWTDASVKNRAVLTVNQTDAGMPQRQAPVTVQTGYEAAAAQMIDEIKAATGQYDASLGSQSNETSGRAIIARQRQGESSTFEFIDNLSRSIAYGGRILIDLIPKVYSYQRVMRVLGEDGDSKEVTVNEQKPDDETGEIVKFNDVTAGKFDVSVTTGPSYATQRVEAADSMMQFIKSVPGSAQVVADLIARNMNWPGAQQIADRLKKMLPPGIDGDEKNSPEDQQMQQQMQQLQQQNDQLMQALNDMQHKQAVEVAGLDIKEYDSETKRLQAVENVPGIETMIQQVVARMMQGLGQQTMQPLPQEQPQPQQPQGAM